MNVLLVDNYDSFTYNLAQYLGELGGVVDVQRNDAITLDAIAARAPAAIVISPGPCTPNEAGISMDVVRRFAGTIPLFGVCLGHQCIGQVFGGRIVRAPRIMHGKTSKIFHDDCGVYAGVPNPFVATRYHSLVIAPESMPDELEVTAKTWEDEIMGVRHRRHLVEGVQFHPESIMTAAGKQLLANFLALARAGRTGGPMTVRIVRAIQVALERRDLSRAEMAEVVGQIMDGEATAAQIGGLLVALRAKGESVDELVGAATAMRSRALPLAVPAAARAIDTCGTGGDGAGTINVSTLAALLVAACGGVVAKHGNRALSSRCGSADVLEALGVAVDVEPGVVERSMRVAGIGFAFAPRFHAATRHAAGPRRELGTRTIFNLLGPLTNPARVGHQVVGVYDQRWCEPMAAALGALGVRRAAVVHGDDGLDELAVRGDTFVALWDADAGAVRALRLAPKQFGCDEVDPAGLAGGDAAHNAAILRKVIAGHFVGHGERYEAVLRAAAMTAALGLALLEPGALALDRLPEHYARAAATVKTGAARLVLHKWREVSCATLADSVAELDGLVAADFAGVE